MFARGEVLQAIDMNSDAYFEEGLKLRCVQLFYRLVICDFSLLYGISLIARHCLPFL